MRAYPIRTFNSGPSRTGDKGKKYGFAADLRLRVNQRNKLAVRNRVWEKIGKPFIETDQEVLLRCKTYQREWQRQEGLGFEFETVMRGQPYHVLVTAGRGFIIATNIMTSKVVCCMMKQTDAYLTTRYEVRS